MRLLKFGAWKIRHFLAILLSAAVTSFIFCMFSRQQSVDLQSLISDTTKHLEQLKENLQVVTKEKKFEVEDRLLTQLGFRRRDWENSSNAAKQQRRLGTSGETSSRVNSSNNNVSLPVVVVVSAVSEKSLTEVPGFLNNVHAHNVLPHHAVVLWNLEKQSDDEEVETEFSLSLKQLCNSSSCWVENFKFKEYPIHVGDLELKAYRPLIIQTMLDRGDCVFWLDIDHRLVPLAAKDRLNGFVNMALHGGSHGIVGWSAARPTSSLTHPKTFTYFQTGAENYYFHRMIDPAQLLICNTEFVHNNIMLPWVECTLTKDCIDPFGAQSSGCRFDKKPLYRYSGCHGYDSSALNVALGLAFPLHQPYISRAAVAYPVHQLTSQNQTTRSVSLS